MNVINLPGNLPYRCDVCKKFIKMGEVHYAIRAYEREPHNEKGMCYESTISMILICRTCAMGVSFTNLKPPTIFP